MSAELRAAQNHTAIADHYRSADSAPAKYAVDRPASASNGFLITFAAISVLALTILTVLVKTGIADLNDPVFWAHDRGDVAVPTRLFIIVFFLTYAVYAYSNRWRRLLIGASLLGKFALTCFVVDLIGWGLYEFGLVALSVFTQQVISALFALAIFPHTIMRQAKLPPARHGPMNPRTPPSAYLRLFLCISLAIVVATLFEVFFLNAVLDLKKLALLGGIGPGVFLVQQVFAALASLLGWRMLARSRRHSFSPPLAVLIPAHDEAHDIAASIFAVDRAAATYPGHIHLYIVDNASTDDTFTVAEQAIAECNVITGVVLECAQPGKAIALNMGVDHITEEFLVRIDADTVIAPGCLEIALRHFADPAVGSVGGLPLPKTQETWIDKVRLVEVLMRHGFFQVALGGYQGLIGVPGMFSVYRRSVVMQVGGIVEGMNGEDTDICLRMNSAGYHTVSDPKAIYYSETPMSYAHLREQRIRWFRSIYHITAHNRDALLYPRSMAGTFVLPFQLVNAARRAMLAPVLIYAVLVEVVFRSTFGDLRWQPVVATILGMQMLLAFIVCFMWWRRSVRHIPAYLLFRFLRSYFTIGAALSLVFPPLEPRWPGSGTSGKQRTSSESGEARTRTSSEGSST
ncbi:glycosyltransferase [Rhodococcus artemisiae]|uniref:Glycosyltransferase n=1 Tax=Rhodococcus artemisiae TaxID=714159 RepID=A0ABU7L5F6_9NOCA|nr:glycosyltransferase [Rhodococcus artemisiae]MEE2056768.1 glycosyltransferase [Rhodococcus artemisiae]